jgi:hypothetical protein
MVHLWLVEKLGRIFLAVGHARFELKTVVYSTVMDRLYLQPQEPSILVPYEVLARSNADFSDETIGWQHSWPGDLPPEMADMYFEYNHNSDALSALNNLRPFLSAQSYQTYRRTKIVELALVQERTWKVVKVQEASKDGMRCLLFFPVFLDENRGLIIDNNPIKLSTEPVFRETCFQAVGISEKLLQRVLQTTQEPVTVIQDLKSCMRMVFIITT